MIGHRHEDQGTNALGSLRSKAHRACSLVISGALAAPVTNAYLMNESYPCYDEGTRTGVTAINEALGLVSTDSSESTGRSLLELRRVTGLTWDQLASIFGVTRRSVHNWANGKALNQGNEEKLYAALDVARRTDRGDAQQNRNALLTKDAYGRSAFDMLCENNIEAAIAILGTTDIERRSPARLAEGELQSRVSPVSPDQLLEALSDRVYNEMPQPRRVPKSKIRKS